MLPKPETHAGIVERVLEWVHVVSLARLVADYAFIDSSIAARILAEHRPVYIVNPSGWDIPAYISLLPEEKTVRVRIDHVSDFPYSPEYRGRYGDVYRLADPEYTIDDGTEIKQPDLPTWTESPMLIQKMINPNTSEELFSDVAGNFQLVDNMDMLLPSQQEENDAKADFEPSHRQSLAKKLVIELGAGEDNGGKLFRMIREDIETIMAGDVSFVPRPIPFKWPPTFDDLRKKFNEPAVVGAQGSP